MKIFNKKRVGIFILTGLAFLALAPSVLAANFNNDARDRATLRVTNFTLNPTCNSCWVTNVSAEVGQTVSFAIYYHNTGPDTAQNVRTRISTSINNNSHTINAIGNVWADNAAMVSGSASVILPSNSRVTGLTHLGTFWQPNQSTNDAAFLFGQSGSEVMSNSGLNLGNISPGWPTQGSVVVRFRIEGTTSANNAPDVTTLSATDIDRESARLRGQVNPRGDSADAWFEWGTNSSNLSHETSRQSIGSGSSFVDFSAFLNSLDSNTTYFFRAVASNSFGTARGGILSFTTNTRVITGNAPDVTTLSATDVGNDSGRLRGEVNPNNDFTEAWFEWGKRGFNLDRETSRQSMGSGSSIIEFSAFLNNLDQDTDYFYRAVARNSFGMRRGDVRSFTTSRGGIGISEPSVRILSATDITSNSATCRGEVNPNGGFTQAWFEWGTTTSLNERTSAASVGSGNNFVNVSATLSGLSSNTTYFCRVVAENSKGRSVSSIESFRTNAGGAVLPSVIERVVTRVVNVSQVVQQPAQPVIILTLHADKSRLGGKKQIVYTVSWENRTSRTLRDASVEAVLPDKVKFENADRSPSEIRGSTLVFRLGNIGGGESGSIRIETKADDLKTGDVLRFQATISYLDRGIRNLVTVIDTTEITKEDLGAGGLAARIFDSFKDFFGNPIFWLLVLLIILFLAYRYFVLGAAVRNRTVPQRADSYYPPTTGSGGYTPRGDDTPPPSSPPSSPPLTV